MKNVSKFVMGYAIMMFVLTLALSVMLLTQRDHINMDLPNVITIGAMLLMGYIVSIGLFFLELTKTEEECIDI
jgi:putative flippase GtrA